MESEKMARGMRMERNEVEYLYNRVLEYAKKADMSVVKPELDKLTGICWDSIIAYISLREWVRDKYNIQVNDWDLPKDLIEYQHKLNYLAHNNKTTN